MMARIIIWLLNIWNKLFGKKTSAVPLLIKKLWHGHEWKRLVGKARSPRKEDKHTKIRKKMADKSRKINRSKKATKGHPLV